MPGRDELFASEKFKDAGVITPATDDSGGKYDPEIISFAKFLMALGQEAGCFDHETDAQTAAQGGSIAQLEAACLHANKVTRAVPGWNGRLYACVTGFQILTRGPEFTAIFNDADGIMFDAPYSNDGKQSGDSLAGPIVDWFTKFYPTKSLIIGEWGCVNTAPNQAAWITQFAVDLQGPRYKNVQKALYWNNAAYAVSGDALQALARAIALSQVLPSKTVAIADLAAIKAAAMAQTVAYGGLEAAYIDLQTASTSFEQANTALLALLAKIDS